MYEAYLGPAVEAARAAEDIIRHYYLGQFDVEHKADDSPVTVADVECEKAIKRVLSAAYPEHGFYGEELGRESADAEYVWLIDPIDGTKSFVRGYPFFSTQIALMHRGELVCGVSNAPLFNGGEMATAAKGAGAWLNDQPIRVSAVDTLARSTLSLGNIASLAASSRWTATGELIGRVHRIRGYGDFYHYHLLASGRIDAIIESDLNILDIAALTVVLREAGGMITDLEGGDIGLETRSVFAHNGRIGPLAREVLDA
jgi:histidinol-phosphatase